MWYLKFTVLLLENTFPPPPPKKKNHSAGFFTAFSEPDWDPIDVKNSSDLKPLEAEPPPPLPWWGRPARRWRNERPSPRSWSCSRWVDLFASGTQTPAPGAGSRGRDLCTTCHFVFRIRVTARNEQKLRSGSLSSNLVRYGVPYPKGTFIAR
jgi:hypothetical protein